MIPTPPSETRRCVLAVGAHPDDIELGCGATLRAHALAGDRVVMLVMSNGAGGPGDVSKRAAEQMEAADRIGAEVRWGPCDDRAITDGFETVAAIEAVIGELGATVVYTHFGDDSHQDHRATSRAVVSAARHVEQVLFYESPSSLNFQPQIYSDVSRTAKDKIAALAAHSTQVEGSRKVSLGASEALMHVRGFQAGVEAAEGFVARRYVFNLLEAAERR